MALFAVGMIGLGILDLVYGDFAMVCEPVASWIPGRSAPAYGSGPVIGWYRNAHESHGGVVGPPPVPYLIGWLLDYG